MNASALVDGVELPDSRVSVIRQYECASTERSDLDREILPPLLTFVTV